MKPMSAEGQGVQVYLSLDALSLLSAIPTDGSSIGNGRSEP